jgi:hypothetical protein
MQLLPPRSRTPDLRTPAKVTVDGPGRLAVMPGTLAKWYAEMGGSVRLMGKPAPVIYEAAMGALGADPKEVWNGGRTMWNAVCDAQPWVLKPWRWTLKPPLIPLTRACLGPGHRRFSRARHCRRGGGRHRHSVCRGWDPRRRAVLLSGSGV